MCSLRLNRIQTLSVLMLALFAVTSHAASPQKAGTDGSWTFAVSGDSRNCGNIVMPAIAAGARHDGASFYWHLGDLRAIYKVDEDYAAEKRFGGYPYPPSISDYLHTAWSDFSQHQVAPFGDMPFFIGIGNHEVIPPKSRTQYRIEFAALLDRPELRTQRLSDLKTNATMPATVADQTYNHWVMRGVDFINLDNTADDAIDGAQLAWFDAILDADLANPAIHSIVVGMHEPLPHSHSDDHSMCASSEGIRSGEHVYTRLAQLFRIRRDRRTKTTRAAAQPSWLGERSYRPWPMGRARPAAPFERMHRDTRPTAKWRGRVWRACEDATEPLA